MTYPRAHLIDSVNGGYYHLMSRCVRRAFLCGYDPHSARSFEHRRLWIENRILELGGIFAVAVYGYAVMSNHYHVVIKVDPAEALTWSDACVVDKWLQVCPGPARRGSREENLQRQRASLLANPERIQILRERLGSLSWYMRFINEPMARMANREDECSGRFWEGRFGSQAILDEASLLSCMVYSDLNPVRAGMASELTEAVHTSGHKRLREHDPEEPLKPLTHGDRGAEDLPLRLKHYLELVHTIADQQSGVRRSFSVDIDRVLKPCGIDQKTFSSYYSQQQHYWSRALGSVDRLRAYVQQLGLRHLRLSPKRWVVQQ